MLPFDMHHQRPPRPDSPESVYPQQPRVQRRRTWRPGERLRRDGLDHRLRSARRLRGDEDPLRDERLRDGSTKKDRCVAARMPAEGKSMGSGFKMF